MNKQKYREKKTGIQMLQTHNENKRRWMAENNV